MLNLSSSRLVGDHFASAAFGAAMSGQGTKSVLKTGAVAAAAVAASNALARKDLAGVALATAAGWGANQLLGEKMNPYLMQNPYLMDEKTMQKMQDNWAKNAVAAQFGPQFGPHGWGAACPARANGGWANGGWGANGWANNGGWGARAKNALGSPMVKGVLLGAAVAYLLSNKEAKASIINGLAKLQNYAAAAVEEIKEQIEDAKASLGE